MRTGPPRIEKIQNQLSAFSCQLSALSLLHLFGSTVFCCSGGIMLVGSIQALEMVFLLLLLFVVAFGALAHKLQIPYPIILVVAGLLLGFVPGTPQITLNPDVIFFVVLPPLLYSAAWLTSWREFSYNLVSILFLAFGLVLFTVFGETAARLWFVEIG